MRQAFDLDKALKAWRKNLRKQQGIEPGYIEELEGNLLDRMEDYIDQGMTEQDAFNKSCEKSLFKPEDLADEFYKLGKSGSKIPPWRRKSSLFSLVPYQVKIALRYLAKRKSTTLLHVSGFSLSLAFSLLVWLYYADQISYDKHFKNTDRIYRVNAQYTFDGENNIYSNVPRPVAPVMKSTFSEVEDELRIRGIGGLETHTTTLKVGDRLVTSKQAFIAEASFFKFFDYELLSGDPSKALIQPNSIVINEDLAKKLFDKKNALGELINVGDQDMEVTGVISSNTLNTHLPVGVLVSWSTYPERPDQWFGGHVYSYVLLNENAQIDILLTKIPSFINQYMAGTLKEINADARFIFQSLASIYLSRPYLWEPYPHGSQTNLNILLLLIGFLLLITTINYVNIANAKSSERMTEIAVRKVLGTARSQLIVQIIIESVILAAISGILALITAVVALPFYNSITGLNFLLAELFTLSHLSLVLFSSVLIGVLSGLYPAYQILSYKPADALANINLKGGTPVLRNILVTIQCGISFLLLVAIMVVYEQTSFIKNKDIGYDKKNLLAINLPDYTDDDSAPLNLKHSILNNSFVEGAALADYALSKTTDQWLPTFERPDGTIEEVKLDLLEVDADFVKTIGTTIISGRDFSKDNLTEDAILVNEAAVSAYGWKDPTDLKFLYEDEDENPVKYNVVGVVKDFNIGVSYNYIKPLMVLRNDNVSKYLYTRIDRNRNESYLSELKGIWENHYPNHAFDYQYVEQSLSSLYYKEDNFLRILVVFSVIIVFATCLGIVGLISQVVTTRRKEIAIRKLIGLSYTQIMVLLSKGFFRIQILAVLLVLPLSYYLTREWLRNFEIKIAIDILPYILSFAICLFFSLLTLFFHITNAASERPVHALKNE